MNDLRGITQFPHFEKLNSPKSNFNPFDFFYLCSRLFKALEENDQWMGINLTRGKFTFITGEGGAHLT